MNPALAALKHHVTGAIARGAAVAIVDKPARPERVKGENRRPVITADILAGLVRLPDLIPYSAGAESRETRAALDYLRRLVAFERSPARGAYLAANVENVRKHRARKAKP